MKILISACLAMLMMLSNPLDTYAASLNKLQVNYIYYNTSGGYTVYREEDFNDFNTASIGLFQIAVDDMAQRSDGYLYECNTKVWLDGVTSNKSVSISFGNPCAINDGVSDAVMQNPYNTLSIALYMTDGSVVYFDGIGGKNDLGNVSTVELANYGTCEMADEIVVTLIQGLDIDRVDIRVALYADQKAPPYRPITWWGQGSLTFGDYNNVPNLVASLDKKVDQIVTPSVIDKDKVDQFEQDVESKKEYTDQLAEDSKVNKPTITDDMLNPMDRVDGTALNEMGGLIGAIFTSPTLGSIATLTLVFALIGYIMYGKKG